MALDSRQIWKRIYKRTHFRSIQISLKGVFAFQISIYLYACMLSCFSCVWLLVTLWTLARQAHLSMGFSKQKYRSGLPCPPPGDLLDSENWTCISYASCMGRSASLPLALLGSLYMHIMHLIFYIYRFLHIMLK